MAERTVPPDEEVVRSRICDDPWLPDDEVIAIETVTHRVRGIVARSEGLPPVDISVLTRSQEFWKICSFSGHGYSV